MPRVRLPDGCYGLDLPGGVRYSARPGGVVEVADHHATMINSSYYKAAGIMTASEPHHIGTKAGRWCTTCSPARLWNAWNHTCPKCGEPTKETTQ